MYKIIAKGVLSFSHPLGQHCTAEIYRVLRISHCCFSLPFCRLPFRLPLLFFEKPTPPFRHPVAGSGKKQKEGKGKRNGEGEGLPYSSFRVLSPLAAKVPSRRRGGREGRSTHFSIRKSSRRDAPLSSSSSSHLLYSPLLLSPPSVCEVRRG